MGTLTYVGKINLGVLTPTSLACGASLSGALTTDLGLLANLSAGMTLSPPSITGSVTSLVTLLTQLAAGITLGVTPLTVNFMADAIASLEATLAVPLAFSLLLGGGAGIFAYGYSGIGSAFGPAVSSALSSSWPDGTSGTAAADAMIVATVTPSVWSDVVGFFGAIPPVLPLGLTFLATCNVGTLCPICITATGGIIANLSARLAGMLRISVSPPSIALVAQVQVALALKASLQAALTLGLPGASFNVAAAAALIAKVNAQIGAIASFSALLTGAGAMVFRYVGPSAGLGPAITTAIGGGWPDGSPASVHANALLCGVVDPAVWATVEAFFGGL